MYKLYGSEACTVPGIHHLLEIYSNLLRDAIQGCNGGSQLKTAWIDSHCFCSDALCMLYASIVLINHERFRTSQPHTAIWLSISKLWRSEGLAPNLQMKLRKISYDMNTTKMQQCASLEDDARLFRSSYGIWLHLSAWRPALKSSIGEWRRKTAVRHRQKTRARFLRSADFLSCRC